MEMVTLPETVEALVLLRDINCPVIKREYSPFDGGKVFKAVVPKDWTADNILQHYNNKIALTRK